MIFFQMQSKENFLDCTTFSKICVLHFIFDFSRIPQLYPLRSRRFASNGMAAWRSGGFYALLFKSALPAAVAPNRSLAAGILSALI
jgi:hypothetical protein